MSSIDSGSFFKTCALVAAGAMFGFTIAKGRSKPEKNASKAPFNLTDINKLEDPKTLLKFFAEKLKNFPPQLDRKLIRLDKSESDPNEFKVMQWNILAKSLCFPDKLSKAPSDTYDWDKYRLWRTLEELVRYDSDIICIEEADVYEEIKPYLHLIGYASIFCPKFASPCLYMDSHVGPDGCAIFYRLSKFQPVNMSCEKIVINSEVNSQVFIILQLKHKQSGKCVTLVCLHLKSKIEYHEKRESQIKEVLASLKVHLRGSFENEIRDNCVILCGDFNGEPFEKFHDLIVNDGDLSLKDAYSLVSIPKEATTIKIRGEDGQMLRRAIDYIFFTQMNLQLTEYLELPDGDLLINEQGLPNLAFPSDHLSLVASFKFSD